MNKRLVSSVAIIAIVATASVAGFTFYVYTRPPIIPWLGLRWSNGITPILFEDFEIMNTSRWYWRTDENGQNSCNNSIAEFIIPNSSSEIYSNAEIYDSDDRLPYLYVTAMFNVCSVNPTNGSRGWGLWNGRFGSEMNLVWFMYMNCSTSHEGLWAYVVRNGVNWSSQVTDVNLSQWHNYTIVWQSNNVDFLVDGEVKAEFDGPTPTTSMRIDVWVDNRTWDDPITEHPINEETKLLVDWIIVY